MVGSRAYGLSAEDSDFDERGIFLAPCDLIWGFDGAPKSIKPDGGDNHYWELKEFLLLALAANPSALEVLGSPSVEFSTPIARELIAMKNRFLSKRAYFSYKGSVSNAFIGLEKEYQRSQTYDAKTAMHMLRLAMVGASILRDSQILVLLNQSQIEELNRIRKEAISWQDISDKYQQSLKVLDDAYANTSLQETSDRGLAEDFLLRARKASLLSL